jgi:hypothetical protein
MSFATVLRPPGVVSPRPSGSQFVALVVMVVVVAVAWLGPGAAGAQEVAAGSTESVQQEYAAAGEGVAATKARAEEVSRQQQDLMAEREALSQDDRAIAEQMTSTNEKARQFVVQSYIVGSDMTVEDSIFRQESAGDTAYKSYLVRDHSSSTIKSVKEVEGARAALDSRLVDLADRIDHNAAELAEANNDAGLAREHVLIVGARLRSLTRPAPPAAPASAAGPAPVPRADQPNTAPGGNAQGAGWDGLRKCESGGNYRIVSSNGLYLGAYQFDVKTWHGLGGSGSPEQNSPAEQDYRAQMLYNARGAQPWPVCGKYLRQDPNIGPRDAVPPP